jgi:DNA-binding CsgD family transcriptional regulator
MEGVPTIEPLTHRENEIVQLISHGNSSKEIGGLLRVSYKTVEVHRYHILRKLKLKNAAVLINYPHHHMPVMYR